MKIFTIEDVRSWKPCYEPERHLKSGIEYTAIDILRDDSIPFEDRLWVVLRTELISEKTMRLFAVWSARQVQHLMKDPRSIAALDVAQRFAMGEATSEELDVARNAAWDATRDATRDAAAWDADTAWDATRDAAAWDADTARAARAAWAAAADAWIVAGAAAGDAQKNKLIEMIEAEYK